MGFKKKTFGRSPGRAPHAFEKHIVRKPFGKGNFELFDVTCDNCNTATQVPFKPTSGKPVLCRECFNKKDSFGPRSTPRPSAPAQTVDLREINEKLDKIMAALDIEQE